MLPTQSPFPQFIDTSTGSPLNGGKIYYGEVNQNPETSPITVYWDLAGTQPVKQPVLTLNGYPCRSGTPSQVFANSDYSISVRDKNGKLIFYSASSASFDAGGILRSQLAASTGASLVGISDGSTLAALIKTGIGKVVSSTDDLKNLDKTKYTRAFVAGYYIDGDGGGGLYYYDADDTTSTDNGGTIIVATDGGRWKLSWTGLLTAKQFGAKGDGTTDDTTAIQAIKTYCESLGIAWDLGDGTFLCNSDFVLNTGTTVRGRGQEISVLKMTGTAKVQSNRSAVTEYVDLRDFKIQNAGTATVGLDIGTLRRSVIRDLYVLNFLIGVSLDIGVSGVANYWNRLFNVTADCTGKTAAGSIGFLFGNNVNVTYPDTDYNNLFGCKSFNCETAIEMVNAIGCKIIGHQATVVGTALTLTAGNDNEIQMVAENCTNIGSAAAGTKGNKIDIYNDGNLATSFVDNGWNYITPNDIGLQILPNEYREIDSVVNDRINAAFQAASQQIIQLLLASQECVATVTLTACGYISGTSEFASIVVFDIVRTGGGTPTITTVRETGTAGVFTAAANSGGTVAISMTGNASALCISNTTVNVQAIGTPQASPYVSLIGYSRTV